MLRRTVVLGAAASALLVLGACRSEKPASFETYTEGLNQALVEKCIIKAAAHRHWSTKVVEPGYIVATLTKESYIACVDIHYDGTGYRITKNPKTNMDSKPGEVDVKFNQWVRNLNKDIRNAAVNMEVYVPTTTKK